MDQGIWNLTLCGEPDRCHLVSYIIGVAHAPTQRKPPTSVLPPSTRPSYTSVIKACTLYWYDKTSSLNAVVLILYNISRINTISMYNRRYEICSLIDVLLLQSYSLYRHNLFRIWKIQYINVIIIKLKATLLLMQVYPTLPIKSHFLDLIRRNHLVYITISRCSSSCLSFYDITLYL